MHVVRHFYGGEVERPVRVTHYFKKREERTVNPILQSYSGERYQTYCPGSDDRLCETNNVVGGIKLVVHLLFCVQG